MAVPSYLMCFHLSSVLSPFALLRQTNIPPPSCRTDTAAPDLIRGHPVSMLVPGLRGCVIIENKMPFSTIGHVMMTGHKKHVPVPSCRRRPASRIAPKCWIPACAGMTDRVDLAIFGIRYQFLLSPWLTFPFPEIIVTQSPWPGRRPWPAYLPG